jgi:hypothetical protein
MSPRRRVPRHAILDAIPEDEEMNVMDKDHVSGVNGLIPHPKLQVLFLVWFLSHKYFFSFS